MRAGLLLERALLVENAHRVGETPCQVELATVDWELAVRAWAGPGSGSDRAGRRSGAGLPPLSSNCPLIAADSGRAPRWRPLSAFALLAAGMLRGMNRVGGRERGDSQAGRRPLEEQWPTSPVRSAWREPWVLAQFACVGYLSIEGCLPSKGPGIAC
jgi:hypothetical protein